MHCYRTGCCLSVRFVDIVFNTSIIGFTRGTIFMFIPYMLIAGTLSLARPYACGTPTGDGGLCEEIGLSCTRT